MQKEDILKFLINTIAGRTILGLLLLAGGWVGVETFALSGEQTVYRMISVPSETTVEVDSPGLDYTVVLGDNKRPSKYLLEYVLEDPEGETLVYEREIVSRKKRQFTFKAASEGEHKLKVNFAGGGESHGAGTSLTVRKGDRTILLKALGWNFLD